MKKTIGLLVLSLFMLSAEKSQAQSLNLPPASNSGNIGTFLANAAKNARAGYLTDLKLHQAGFLAVPFPAITSQDKSIEYGALELGVDLGAGVNGTKMHGAPLVLPMLNLGSIPHLLGRNASIASHTVFPNLGDVEVGIGILPLPVPGANGKWVLGNQVVGAVQVGL